MPHADAAFTIRRHVITLLPPWPMPMLAADTATLIFSATLDDITRRRSTISIDDAAAILMRTRDAALSCQIFTPFLRSLTPMADAYCLMLRHAADAALLRSRCCQARCRYMRGAI